jgi:hypothetical protein
MKYMEHNNETIALSELKQEIDWEIAALEQALLEYESTDGTN